MPRGLFVAFEGIDGSGKTTPLAKTRERLLQSGTPCLSTHEPRRESVLGKRIYRILNGEEPMVSPFELQRLYVEDRLDHVENEIKPALKHGETVLCDRYWFSTIAYGMLSEPMDKFIGLHIKVFNGTFLMPDITFLFDLPPEIAIERLRKIGKKDYFEELSKLSRIRRNYLTLAHSALSEVKIIDATKTPDEITEIITNDLELRQKSPRKEFRDA